MTQYPKTVIAEVDPSLLPVAGLVPATHVFAAYSAEWVDVDGRDEPGHGVRWTMAQWVSTRRMYKSCTMTTSSSTGKMASEIVAPSLKRPVPMPSW